MIKKIVGNLWLWVVGAFVAIILGWYFTIKAASTVTNDPIEKGEVIERQPPISHH